MAAASQVRGMTLLGGSVAGASAQASTVGREAQLQAAKAQRKGKRGGLSDSKEAVAEGFASLAQAIAGGSPDPSAELSSAVKLKSNKNKKARRKA